MKITDTKLPAHNDGRYYDNEHNMDAYWQVNNALETLGRIYFTLPESHARTNIGTACDLLRLVRKQLKEDSNHGNN